MIFILNVDVKAFRHLAMVTLSASSVEDIIPFIHFVMFVSYTLTDRTQPSLITPLGYVHSVSRLLALTMRGRLTGSFDIKYYNVALTF